MKLKTVKQFKEHVGGMIHAIPTGNNARGAAKNERFMVISTAVKYVKLVKVLPDGELSNAVREYKPETGALKGDCNAGYIFFDTEKAINDHIEDGEKLNEVQGYFRRFGNSRMTSEDIRTIHSIVSKYD